MDDKFKLDRMKKKMGIDYSKGKGGQFFINILLDSQKLLNQMLKRQKNQKAGLGFKEEEKKDK